MALMMVTEEYVIVSISKSIPSHTGLYKIIKKKYGESTIVSIRHYVKSSEKLASMKQSLTFNIRAKRYNLILKSLRVRPLVNTYEGRKIALDTSKKFLIAKFVQHQLFLKKTSLTDIENYNHIYKNLIWMLSNN